MMETDLSHFHSSIHLSGGGSGCGNRSTTGATQAQAESLLNLNCSNGIGISNGNAAPDINLGDGDNPYYNYSVSDYSDDFYPDFSQVSKEQVSDCLVFQFTYVSQPCLACNNGVCTYMASHA